MQVTTVKGIYASNTFVVDDNGIKIVIDAGAPIGTMRQVLGNKPPTAIFLTHEHFDHVAHIADYAAAYPKCPIYCHPATLKELKTNEINSVIGAFAGVDVRTPDSFENFRTLENNQVIGVNQYDSATPFRIKAIFAPGHSDGSVLYLTGNKLFTGDVLFDGTIGRTDLVPNGYAQMQTTLRNLQSLEFEKAYHGHGDPSSFEQQQKNIRYHTDVF